MTKRAFPPAHPHGDIEELFPGIHLVTGTTDFGNRVPMRFSRNMTIIEQDGVVTLVNTVRLNEGALSALERIGDVKHIIRLAGFHGMDDPFYKDRYGATVWSVDAPYLTGFGAGKKPYFEADKVIGDQTVLPLEDTTFFGFKSANPKEGLLLINCEDGIVVSGDCLQNWARPDQFFSLPARLMMRVMGFIKPYNIGPGWLKSAKPDKGEIKSLLDLEFNHVLPVHGAPVIGNAKQHYAPAISAL
ncbi:MAG: hypothetical protein ACR2PF_09665 [Rhizobiaceae bacterium]